MAGDDSNEEKTKVLKGEQRTLNQELEKASQLEACLIIIRGNPQGQRYFLTQPSMTIGRDSSADITVNDASISRKHARVEKQGSNILFTDLGSSNGTVINGRKLTANESVTLNKEDMITLANTVLKFLPAGQLETLAYGNLGDAANTDPLTRIYNKGYLMQAFETELKRAKALHADFSVLFFDLDHFKKINDTYGHDAGDFILKEFTQLVRGKHIRPKDVFGRYGGEEFMLLLGNTNAQQAAEIAERIRASVEAHAFVYDGKRIHVTTSIGVAELQTGIESVQALIKLTDKALYESKSNGRNRITISNA